MSGPKDTETSLADDLDLMAYVDGTLPPEKMAEIEARLAHDADARDAVAQWRHHDNLIRQVASAAEHQPASLQIATLERELAARLKARRWRARLLVPSLQRIAASVLIFAAGWAAHGYFASPGSFLATAHPQFVDPTVLGHYGYKQAAFERARFDAADMDSALDWMSEQMQAKIDSPRLARLGYEVESARLMVDDDIPIAMFYFRNAEDERVTVSMTPRQSDQPAYRLRVVNMAEDNIAYWSSDAMHYTVVANVERGRLTTIAAAVPD